MNIPRVSELMEIAKEEGRRALAVFPDDMPDEDGDRQSLTIFFGSV